LAIFGVGTLEMLAVKSATVADVLIVVVLGVRFKARSFSDGAILT
jgi:hypothetical protein